MFSDQAAATTQGRTSAPGADGDAPTRDVVLQRISTLGPISATGLAREMGLTSAAVRRHLEALEVDGLIERVETAGGPRGRGRPARSYVLTPTGHRRLQSGYDDVATSALEFLAQRLGQSAVSEFAREQLEALEARYAPVVNAAGEDPERRAQALAGALADDGYAASARPVGPSGLGLQLCQGHCPMHEVAARFPQFCEEETEVFARLLGVRVQRLATLAGGEHVCTTFVPREPVALGAIGLRPTAADDPRHREDQQDHRHHEGTAR